MITEILSTLTELVRACPERIVAAGEPAAPALGSRFEVVDMHSLKTAAARGKAAVAGLVKGVRLYVALPGIKNTAKPHLSPAAMQVALRPMVTLELVDTLSDKSGVDAWAVVESLAAHISGEPSDPTRERSAVQNLFHFEGCDFTGQEGQAGKAGAAPGVLLYVCEFSLVAGTPAALMAE